MQLICLSITILRNQGEIILKSIEEIFSNVFGVNVSEMNDNISYIDYEKDSFSFCLYKDHIKFLLICRKHTLGYLEFIRGRYKINNYDNIAFLFRQMTKQEQQLIYDNDFDYLQNYLVLILFLTYICH